MLPHSGQNVSMNVLLTSRGIKISQISTELLKKELDDVCRSMFEKTRDILWPRSLESKLLLKSKEPFTSNYFIKIRNHTTIN